MVRFWCPLTVFVLFWAQLIKPAVMSLISSSSDQLRSALWSFQANQFFPVKTVTARSDGTGSKIVRSQLSGTQLNLLNFKLSGLSFTIAKSQSFWNLAISARRRDPQLVRKGKCAWFFQRGRWLRVKEYVQPSMLRKNSHKIESNDFLPLVFGLLELLFLDSQKTWALGSLPTRGASCSRSR